MKKNFNLASLILLMLVGMMTFASCCKESDTPAYPIALGGTPTQSQIDIEGIFALQQGIKNFNMAYITKHGYFAYMDNMNPSGSATNEKYNTVTYMSANGQDKICIVSRSADLLPSQIVTNDGILYFSYPDPNTLELLFDNGSGIVKLETIPCNTQALAAAMALANINDIFKTILANVVALLKNGASTYCSIFFNSYGTIFSDICGYDFVTNPTVVPSFPTTPDGTYNFVNDIDNWYTPNVQENVTNALSLWTGEATYKVGGSSCTLSGNVFCPAGNYNEYGTYGIICDADPSKLFLGAAEYEGTGKQTAEDISYSVDFRGFKPNTTYYYRAYYKFNSSDHGNIVPKYGTPADQVVYDTTIKSFSTGDNRLTVDVAMCIDVTGSMSSIINTVKKNAIGFYDQFKASCDKAGITLDALNTQVFAYRDKNVDKNWLEASSTFSLPTQKSEFDAFVSGLYAEGGGDTPESGMEVLQKAFSKADWGVDDGFHRQVVILWTDAPYLIGSYYADFTVEEIGSMWDKMPSGRRLILFAPNGNPYSDSNGGDWTNLDGRKNVIHEADLVNGFNNFEYILESIIGELTGKAKAMSAKPVTFGPGAQSYFFAPNK